MLTLSRSPSLSLFTLPPKPQVRIEELKYQLPRHFLLRRRWKITQRTRNVSFNIYHSREDKQCRVSQCRMMHAMYLRNILVASGVEYHSSVVTGLILFYFGSQIFLAD